ncbi:DNA polymerase IV [Gammaproteobacteria bacterium 42_54_T18]|nr:DNA polymerase IV [Gammaproteobacteria bacterium 42_54_T18]
MSAYIPKPLEQANRKIIHVDCDCFYASLEMLDNPYLRNKPIAVGGDADRRGVIATCNYEARKFGIHSAMASSTAKRLCPHLTIVPPRMNRYREASKQIQQIFKQFTPTIEPLSLDEAYLDVSGQQGYKGSATLMAQAIQSQVFQEVGITVSAGIAPNKFLAKIASDWNKPNGRFIITPAEVDGFVQALPVSKLSGVGKATQKKLAGLGIVTCNDVRNYVQNHSIFELTKHLGVFGKRLHQLAYGFDNRPVQAREFRKSLSVEHTYSKDLRALSECIEKLPELQREMENRLNKQSKSHPIKKAFIKIKFSDFTQTTIERCIQRSVQEPHLNTYQTLCEEAFVRGNKPVRLLGLGVRFEEPIKAGSQLSFCFPAA